MAAEFAVRTALDILAAAGVIVMVFNEKKLIAFEDRVCRKVKKLFSEWRKKKEASWNGK